MVNFKLHVDYYFSIFVKVIRRKLHFYPIGLFINPYPNWE